jgi:hypothetical protein
MTAERPGSSSSKVRRSENSAEKEEVGRKVDYQYRDTDVGPFRVIVERTTEPMILNKLRLGMELKNVGFQHTVVEIKKIGKNKAIVYFSSGEQANKLTKCDTMVSKGYKAYVPRYFVSTKGVLMYVDTDITEEEIYENIETELEVMDVYRLNKFVDGTRKPIPRVTVTFRCNRLPTYVKLFLCRIKVEPYIPRTIICENCLRYGHLTRNCKNGSLCKICTQPTHEGTSCRKMCKYCDTYEHDTLSKDCPNFNKQKAIDAIKAKKGMVYQEIIDSYKITTENCYEILDKVDDFPTIQETFADVLKKPTGTKRREVAVKSKAKQKPTIAVEQVNEVAEETGDKGQRRREATKRRRENSPLIEVNPHATTEMERFVNQLSGKEGREVVDELVVVQGVDGISEKVKELFKAIVNMIVVKNGSIVEEVKSQTDENTDPDDSMFEDELL